jgi:hypothetical protein
MQFKATCITICEALYNQLALQVSTESSEVCFGSQETSLPSNSAYGDAKWIIKDEYWQREMVV